MNKTAEFSSHDVMLFLPDDGFQPDLELGEEFLVRQQSTYAFEREFEEKKMNDKNEKHGRSF